YLSISSSSLCVSKGGSEHRTPSTMPMNPYLLPKHCSIDHQCPPAHLNHHQALQVYASLLSCGNRNKNSREQRKMRLIGHLEPYLHGQGLHPEVVPGLDDK
ncbi:unnamed protein product, partial [Ectocarpus sp. 8 AP-2014]